MVLKLIKLTLLFLLNYSYHNFIALSKQNDDLSIEAGFVKSGKNEWKARGDVILKKEDLLLNADEVDAFREEQIDKETQEKTKKMIIEATNDVRIRQDNDNIIYSKSFFLDQRTDTGLFKDFQLFRGAPKDNSMLFANQLEKSKCTYSIKNSTFCPCLLFRDDNVLKNRKNPFKKMTEEDELLLLPKQKNPIDNTSEEIHNDLQKKTLLSVHSEEINYDDNEKLATIKNFTIRSFGVPFLYWPKFSFHTDGRGDSGLLMPKFVMNGLKQAGIEIPLYWKIRPDIDLIASRIQYIPMKTSWKETRNENVNKYGNGYKLDDLYKIRQSMTGFRFRHLVSTKYGYASFYKIDFLITDPTQLLDEETSVGAVKKDGSIKKGVRWIVDLISKMQLTKSTFLDVEQLYTSDTNFLYIQKHDNRQMQTNKFHLYDVSDNHYLSFELYKYEKMILNLDEKTLPVVFPIIRGNYQFKKDKLGGNFYTKIQTYYINREEGYSHGTLALDIGYRLPYIFKKGTKITFDTMIRNQYDNVKTNDFSTQAIQIHRRKNALLFYYGNYANLYNNPYYGQFGGAENKYTFLNFNKLQAEHPILLLSALGKTIISPKIALRYSPNNGRNIHIPADDNFGMYMNYYNAFELMQSSGLGIYDTGASIVYGADVSHKFNRQINFSFGLAQNFRLAGDVNSEKLADYTGYRQSMSDLMGYLLLKFKWFNFYGYFNYDTQHKIIRMFSGSFSFGIKPLSLTIMYHSFSKYATFIGQNIDLLTIFANIKPMKKLTIRASISYNPTGIETGKGYRKPGISSYSILTYYTISCFRLGFSISHTLMVLPNIPSTTTYSFKFALTGIG